MVMVASPGDHEERNVIMGGEVGLRSRARGRIGAILGPVLVSTVPRRNSASNETSYLTMFRSYMSATTRCRSSTETGIRSGTRQWSCLCSLICLTFLKIVLDSSFLNEA